MKRDPVPPPSPGSVPADRADLVVVANRLPTNRTEDGGWEVAPGGLVTALAPIMADRGGIWIGWTGDVERGPEPPFEHSGFTVWPLDLSADEHDRYYSGVANATIWPLYHSGIHPASIDRSWWSAYRDVNARFAAAAAEAAAPGGNVWVHDYHLQLVPRLLRRRRPDLRIGFFLHTPFPPSELFLRLPWRADIARGLLGADTIGFQTETDARHFRTMLARVLDLDIDGAAPEPIGLRWDGRHIEVRAMPISIDVEAVDRKATSSGVQRRARRLRRELGHGRTVLLGVDRLDYTKGIDARLEAYRELLRDRSLDPDRVTFVQIANPSRPDVPGYRDISTRVDQLVGEINGEFGRPGVTPVEYYRRNHSFDELCSWYRVADVMVVTPYRDGMNLVAKEFVAARSDECGSLVLSEFAGTAASLEGALLCNPFDIDDLKIAILAAVKMPDAEQRRRMRSMRSHLAERTVAHWAGDFLRSLDSTSPTRQPTENNSEPRSPRSGPAHGALRSSVVNGGLPARDPQILASKVAAPFDVRSHRLRRATGKNDT